MSSRVVVTLTILLLVAVNTVLVVSDVPCPSTGGAWKYEPGTCPCPMPANNNCDYLSYDWIISGFAWVILSDHRYDIYSEAPFGIDYYRESIYSDEAYYWEDDLYPYFWGYESFIAYLIAPTNARCGNKGFVRK